MSEAIDARLHQLVDTLADAKALAEALSAQQAESLRASLQKKLSLIAADMSRLSGDALLSDPRAGGQPLQPWHYATLGASTLADPRVLAAYASPTSAADFPRLVRIGELRLADKPANLDPSGFAPPAMVPVLGTASLILEANGASMESANATIQSMAIRLVAALPPGKARLLLVDNPGVGHAFGDLMSLDPKIRGDLAWHDPRQIEERLSECVDHMAVIMQKSLGHQYADLEAFNSAAGELAEPYRIVLVAGFPAGITKRAAEKILTIARKGRPCGVYLLLTLDAQVRVPPDFGLDELRRVCTLLSATEDGAFRWPAENIEMVPSQVPSKFTSRVAEVGNEPASKADHVVVPFSRLVPTALWTESASDGLSAPIGFLGARDVLKFEIGSQQSGIHHALVAGKTGSGKSVLLHDIITSLCLRYSPQELELYLIDFKGGVEFQVYRNLPHARVVALQSEREFGLSVLEGLHQELTRRESNFRDKGGGTAANLRDFRKITGVTESRILFIADEFQVFFQTADRLASRAVDLLDDIARRGRSFGVHLLLSSQTISGTDLEQSTLSQLELRIALKLDESDSCRFLSKDNVAAAFLERPGDAIYNPKGGRVDGNKKFQVAFFDAEERTQLVRTMADFAAAKATGRHPQIFDGTAASKATDNGDFVRLASADPRAIVAPRAAKAYLGEPVALSQEHTFFKFVRQNRSLLLLGQDENDAFLAFFSACLSWGLHYPPGGAHLLLLNLASVDDPIYDHFEKLRGLGADVEMGERREVPAFLAKAREELDRRLQAGGRGQAPWLLGIFGLQRARDLHREGGKVPTPTADLVRLLRDGPDMAMHVITWADTYANLLRTLEAKEVNEFDGRVALAGDSGRVLGDHGTHFVPKRRYGVLYAQDEPEVLRKFRFYEFQSMAELAEKAASRRK